MAQKKNLEKELGRKRKELSDAKKDLKKVRMEKTKMETPTVASIENIFLNFSILPAAYHGGKLNGVNCREVMALASVYFKRLSSSCFLYHIQNGMMRRLLGAIWQY